MYYTKTKKYAAIQFDGSNFQEILDWEKTVNVWNGEIRQEIHILNDKLTVKTGGGVVYPEPGDWIVFDGCDNRCHTIVDDEVFSLTFKP